MSSSDDDAPAPKTATAARTTARERTNVHLYVRSVSPYLLPADAQGFLRTVYGRSTARKLSRVPRVVTRFFNSVRNAALVSNLHPRRLVAQAAAAAGPPSPSSPSSPSLSSSPPPSSPSSSPRQPRRAPSQRRGRQRPRLPRPPLSRRRRPPTSRRTPSSNTAERCRRCAPS